MKFQLATASAGLSILMTAGMAGTFFGFSVGVMPGLNATRASSAIAAMNAINQKIQNPLFLGAFMLAPVVAVVAGVLLMMLDQKHAAWLFFAAAGVYFVGAFLPTAAVNVPMNNHLAHVKVPHDLAAATKVWTDYSGRWTTWNSVRAVCCGASLLLMGAGAFLWGRSR
ncbi:anthrone oxygenase family protein [Actinomadura rupiterrae]|uniref:anthrone oxygenase family protein n=1 Tax=Actinomadura rupiterrae TaxID=559627 RepID=UPI0020A2BA96|nr:anthrone oxygenase family protein [Actinomadura rupiterrae]MCP2338663.1 putative membrane protein [Actinomadura rupiterrae]